MTVVENQELVTEVTREILAARFPEELPLLRAQSQAYFEDPKKALDRRGGGREEMLAFGAGEAVALVTPIALAVIGDLMPYLLDQVRDSIKSESEPYIQRSVRRLFKKLEPKTKEAAKKESGEEGKAESEEADSPDSESIPSTGQGEAEPVALTAEQLADVRARAVEKAKALGLDDARAELLADAIAGSLRTR